MEAAFLLEGKRFLHPPAFRNLLMNLNQPHWVA